jgi:hypothetical protein
MRVKLRVAVHSPSVRRSLLCQHCSSTQFQSSECFRLGTMGDGKVRVMDLACRGGSLEDRVSAACKSTLRALDTQGNIIR